MGIYYKQLTYEKTRYSLGETPLGEAIAAKKLNTARLLIMHGVSTKNIVIPPPQKAAIETALEDRKNYKFYKNSNVTFLKFLFLKR